jgi:uncharacterized protein (DUF1778 family)
MNMRSDDEKKDKLCSFRANPEERQIIRENAEKCGLNLSEYMLRRCTKTENSITPEVMVKIQDIVNLACSLADEKNSYFAGYLRERVKELWYLLK